MTRTLVSQAQLQRGRGKVFYWVLLSIVVAVFTTQNRGSFFDLEATIGRVAEDVLDAWGGAP